MKLLSVVIPVYNTKPELFRRCLQPLADFDELEAIIVDDGSQSDAWACLEVIVRDSLPQAAVYRKENGGQNSARSFGTQRACGKYTLFLDSDDYLDEEALRGLLDALGTADEKIVSFDYQLVHPDGSCFKSIDRWAPGLRPVPMTRAISSCESLSLQAYLTDFLKAELPKLYCGVKIGEDLSSALVLLLDAGGMSSCGVNLYRYVKHGGSTLSAPCIDTVFDIQKAFDYVMAHVSDSLDPESARALSELAVRHVLYWGGIRSLQCLGYNRRIKRATLQWMDSRVPGWKELVAGAGFEGCNRMLLSLLANGHWACAAVLVGGWTALSGAQRN